MRALRTAYTDYYYARFDLLMTEDRSYGLLSNSLFCLKVEAILPSKIVVSIYQTTRPHIPEDSNLDIRIRENLRAQKQSNFAMR
jgi:hypothetical protein